MEKHGIITKVSGPLIVAKGMASVQVYDVVRVSEKRLIGEVLELRDDLASIQVYEETAGIGPGEPVYLTDYPLSVELGPGLIESIFDGIQRPLTDIYNSHGAFIPVGVSVPKLDRSKLWTFEPKVKVGDKVIAGDIIGTVQETPAVVHKILAPYGIEGIVKDVKSGDFTITDTVVTLTHNEK